MKFFTAPTYRCFYKEEGKLAQVDVGNIEANNYLDGLDKALNMVKMSLMKNSLPFEQAVLYVMK